MALALSACANPGPPQIPVSGVSGPNGGVDQTTYYNKNGQGRFAN